MESVESFFAAQQEEFDGRWHGRTDWVKPITYTPIDVERARMDSPWPWPRSLTNAEIAEYQAMLGDEYRMIRCMACPLPRAWPVLRYNLGGQRQTLQCKLLRIRDLDVDLLAVDLP